MMIERTLEALRAVLEWLFLTETGRITALGAALFYLLAWWRIFARAGLPSALALLMLLPPFAVCLWVFLAFAPWPARRELAALRKVQRVVHQAEKRRLAS